MTISPILTTSAVLIFLRSSYGTQLNDTIQAQEIIPSPTDPSEPRHVLRLGEDPFRLSSANDNECSRTSNASVNCILEYRNVIYKVIANLASCNPIAWLKIIHPVIEKCIMETVSRADCFMILGIAVGKTPKCRHGFENMVEEISKMASSCRDWVYDNVDYNDPILLAQLRCIIEIPLLKTIAADWDDTYPMKNTYCTNRKIGWIDDKNFGECKQRCESAGSKYFAFRVNRKKVRKGMCACCHDPPKVEHALGVDLYRVLDPTVPPNNHTEIEPETTLEVGEVCGYQNVSTMEVDARGKCAEGVPCKAPTNCTILESSQGPSLCIMFCGGTYKNESFTTRTAIDRPPVCGVWNILSIWEERKCGSVGFQKLCCRWVPKDFGLPYFVNAKCVPCQGREKFATAQETKQVGEPCGSCYNVEANYDCGKCVPGLECVKDDESDLLPDLPSRCRVTLDTGLTNVMSCDNGDGYKWKWWIGYKNPDCNNNCCKKHKCTLFHTRYHKWYCKEDSCFPGSSTVMMENGERRKMKDLQVGDSVLSIDSGGQKKFSPVILFHDINQNHVGEFYVIHTESGHSISLTQEHLIYKKNQNEHEKVNPANVNANRSEVIMTNPDFAKMAYFKSFPPAFASDVKEGDFVLIFDKKDGLKPSLVKKIQKTVNEGLYAPLTLEGNLLVDDVLASCYATVSDEWLAHVMFAPIRFFHKISEYMPFASIKLDDANLRKKNNENLHWYSKGLRYFVDMFLPTSLRKKLNFHSSHVGSKTNRVI